MPHDRPFEVIGFHSCTRKIGLAALNGAIDLNLSDNPWDWLGKGLYFWEQNPLRSLEYGIESALHEQLYVMVEKCTILWLKSVPLR
jgi:hypothetical protein